MDKRCKKCLADCCRYFALPIGQPESYEDFEEIRWHLLHRGVSVFIDGDGQWNLVLRNLCRMLRKTAEGWRCKDYDNRPTVCREFSPDTCNVTRGGQAYEERFTTAGQLDAYARRMLGGWVFDKARAEMKGHAKRRARTERSSKRGGTMQKKIQSGKKTTRRR